MREKTSMSNLYVKDHRDYLRREFEARANRRPLYSQRAFARDINLSPSTLSDYFKGNLGLSAARAHQISKFIGLNPEQQKHWIDLINIQFSKSGKIRQESELRVKCRLQSQLHRISLDQFKVISDWYHLAYLELLQLNSQKYSNLNFACKALNVPLKTLQMGVGRLESLGLIEKNQEGIFSARPNNYLGDTIPSLAIRQFHTQVLKKALESIEDQPMSQRFISTTMVALPNEEVEKILSDIKHLADRYLDPYIENCQSLKKDMFYCLNIQFFNLISKKEQK